MVVFLHAIIYYIHFSAVSCFTEFIYFAMLIKSLLACKIEHLISFSLSSWTSPPLPPNHHHCRKGNETKVVVDLGISKLCGGFEGMENYFNR